MYAVLALGNSIDPSQPCQQSGVADPTDDDHTLPRGCHAVTPDSAQDRYHRDSGPFSDRDAGNCSS
ncbi:hypothetical protein RSAG8_09510, partial [Rhizoctonia solani AG-8 WAC10335]